MTARRRSFAEITIPAGGVYRREVKVFFVADYWRVQVENGRFYGSYRTKGEAMRAARKAAHGK